MPFISLRSFSPTGVIVTEENGMTEGEKGWDEESVRPNLTSFPCHCHPLVQPSSLCRSPGVSSPVSSRSLCSAPHLTVRFLTSFSPYDWRWMRREKRPTIEPEAGTKWDKNRVKWEKEWSEVTTCHASRTVIITALSAPTLRSLFVPFAGRYGERMMTGNAGVKRVPVSRSFGSLRSMPIPPHSIRLPKGMVFMMINL